MNLMEEAASAAGNGRAGGLRVCALRGCSRCCIDGGCGCPARIDSLPRREEGGAGP